jgi:hypothetical protein
MQSNMNNVNAQTAIANQNQSSNIFSGVGNAVSSVLGPIGSIFAHGGEVKKPHYMAEGGVMAPSTSGPQSFAGQWLNSSTNTQGPTIAPAAQLNTSVASPFNIKGAKATPSAATKEEAPSAIGAYNPGGTDIYQSPNFGSSLMQMNGDTPLTSNNFSTDLMNAPTGMVGEANGGLMEKGGNVKPKDGKQKAVVKGDSLANDKIPAMLSEGEVVMDRETLADKGTIGQMARAVAAHIDHRNKMKGKK